jgi:hypothetical protein
VHEDDRRPALARLEGLREEELVMCLHPVGRLHDDDFRRHVLGLREVGA